MHSKTPRTRSSASANRSAARKRWHALQLRAQQRRDLRGSDSKAGSVTFSACCKQSVMHSPPRITWHRGALRLLRRSSLFTKLWVSDGWRNDVDHNDAPRRQSYLADQLASARSDLPSRLILGRPVRERGSA